MEDLRCTETFRDGLSPLGGRQTYGGGCQSYSQPLVCRAYKDPVILEDSRVFQNMLNIEEFYVAAVNYFANTQHQIKPHMRKIVTEWMLEVCLDQNCHADVFLLACNIMDRCLSQIDITKSQFQLVAAATIFIASKLVDPCPITGLDLIKYTDNTYSITELLEMELLILSKLKWDLSALTPYDFLEYLLRLLADDAETTEAATSVGQLLLEQESGADLRRHTENFIILCATEFRFSNYPPSMLSSAALAAAANSINNSHNSNSQNSNNSNSQNSKNSNLNSLHQNLVQRLHHITGVENECLQSCIRQIEDTFKAASENVNNQIKKSTAVTINGSNSSNNSSSTKVSNSHNNSNSNNSNNQGKLQEREDVNPERKANTPTEVFSVDWLYVA